MKVCLFNLHHMGRSYADMPLHYGQVPAWLYTRMSTLGVAITEAIVMEYGRGAFLQRLSDPFWFQALGCVLGMDWHSSGITTSVMGALKRSVNERSSDLGIYICGGKGKYSRETPSELMSIAHCIFPCFTSSAAIKAVIVFVLDPIQNRSLMPAA
jgi:hypothetical protein